MARFEAVSPQTLRDLEILKKAGLLKGFYLGGGTGLAFLLGHRESQDLDFFRQTAFKENQLVEKIKNIGKFSLEKRETGTVKGRFQNTLVSFFHYPYHLLEKPKSTNGISVASIRDIACMKLDALASRGTKRDFIDLYFVVVKSGLSVKKLLGSFSKKYSSVRYNSMHLKKSLVYFVDAENDPTPKMFIPVDWEKVKKFFVSEAKGL